MSPSEDASPVSPKLIRQMLDQHGPALALFASQWTTEPDDCVQQALVELARQSVAPDSPVAWLYRVVKHRALSVARGADRRRQREQIALRCRLLATRASGDPAEALELVDLLSQIDSELREAVVLRLWGGLTLAEVGRTLDVSTATAQRRYEQAIAQLRTVWRPSCPSTPIT